MSAQQRLNLWGQQTFASNYTKGGITSYMFSPGGRRPGGIFGGAKEGGYRHIRRLEKMRDSGRYNTKAIQGVIDRVNAPKAGGTPAKPWKELSKVGKVGRVGSKMMKAAFSMPGGVIIGGAMGAYMTEGDATDKATGAVAFGIGSTIGWHVGSKAGVWAGAAAGAAIGSVVPVVGTAVGGLIGGAIGYLGGGFGGAYLGEQATFGIKSTMDKKVDIARKQKYASGWYGDQSAFNTQKAATMRQYSLQAMNQGMMSARSGLGHEGVMVHQ